MPPKGAPKRLTHFLCIPLLTPASRPQLQTSLRAFSVDLKDDRTPQTPQGIPEKAIRPLGTLHLTLGVMSLLTPERIEGALSLLHSLDMPSLLAPHPVSVTPEPGQATATLPPTPTREGLEVTLRGLESMHAPSKTSILYAPPSDPTGRLHAFCSALRAAFSEFLVPDERPLLLHATLVNTVYVPSSTGGGRHGGRHGQGESASNRKQKRVSKMTINARDILERYTDVVWMEGCRVEKVAICRMGARMVRDGEGRETGDEEYLIEGEMRMPVTVG